MPFIEGGRKWNSFAVTQKSLGAYAKRGRQARWDAATATGNDKGATFWITDLPKPYNLSEPADLKTVSEMWDGAWSAPTEKGTVVQYKKITRLIGIAPYKVDGETKYGALPNPNIPSD